MFIQIAFNIYLESVVTDVISHLPPTMTFLSCFISSFSL